MLRNPSGFPDVLDGAYYADAVAWAVELQLMPTLSCVTLTVLFDSLTMSHLSAEGS